MSFYSVDFDGSREQAAKIKELSGQCAELLAMLNGMDGTGELAAGLEKMGAGLAGISDDIYAAAAAREAHDNETLDRLDPFPEVKRGLRK